MIRKAAALALLCLPLACKEAPKEKPNAWDPPKPSAVAVASAAPATDAAAPPPGSAVQAAAAASVARTVPGGELEVFLPPAGLDGAADRVVRPSKAGVCEAVYKKGKEDVATVTISDTESTPSVRDDYKDVTDKVAGYPLKTSGTTKSAILVANRFQVTVASPRLKPDARRAWLEKTDLAGLAKAR